MAQEIVFYHSEMQGAPSRVLTTAGALLAVLDACLVDGFNVNSISTLTQSAGVATATTSGTNGFSAGEWVEVAGATPAAYNGRVKVTGKPGTDKFTYAVPPGTASPASGTMTAKYPGAGWSKTVAGTNIAAYQGGAGSLGHWMQVEDNNPYADANLSIRTRMAAGWTALDSATVQLGNASKIAKLTGGWMVFADAKTVYLYFGNIAAQTATATFCFGEIAPFYGADAFSFFNTRGDDQATTVVYTESGSTQSGIYPYRVFPFVRLSNGIEAGGPASLLRSVAQVGGPVVAEATAFNADMRIKMQNSWAVVPQDLLVPSLADATVPIAPIYLSEFTPPNLTLRGKLRGVHMPLGGMPDAGFVNSFQRLDAAVVDGVSQSVVLLNTNNLKTGRTGNGKQLVFQVDGSWG